MERGASAGVAAANAAFGDAYGRGDVAALMDVFYGPGAYVDGGAMLPGTTDPEAIVAFFAGMRDAGFVAAELATERLDDHGDWAVETGVATLRGQAAAQEASIRYCVVWGRTGAGWRVRTDFFAPLEG